MRRKGRPAGHAFAEPVANMDGAIQYQHRSATQHRTLQCAMGISDHVRHCGGPHCGRWGRFPLSAIAMVLCIVGFQGPFLPLHFRGDCGSEAGNGKRARPVDQGLHGAARTAVGGVRGGEQGTRTRVDEHDSNSALSTSVVWSSVTRPSTRRVTGTVRVDFRNNSSITIYH
jgi:hypothetical protein